MDDDLVRRLARFEKRFFPRYREACRRLVVEGQKPRTLFLGCSDSRIERHVRDALWLQRCIAAAALAPAVALTPLDSSAAGAQLGVGATVPLVAAMKMLYQAPTIEITEADIDRGYVDVRGASRFSVATTSRVGYAVDLVAKLPLFAAVHVSSALGSARLGPEGGTLVARGRPRRDANAELTYRFELAREVRPGSYPFPLHLAVRPL